MDSLGQRLNNLMIPKTLVKHNVPWPPEEKLWITLSMVPASPTSMCPAVVCPLARALTAQAPYSAH